MFRVNTSLEASSSASAEAERLADGLNEGAVLLIVWSIPAFVSSTVVSGNTADGAIGNVTDRLKTDSNNDFCIHCEQKNI